MQKEAAPRRLKETLKKAIDEDAFRLLVCHLFKESDEQHRPAFTGAYVYDSFRAPALAVVPVGCWPSGRAGPLPFHPLNQQFLLG